jgi:hypothetical protein
VRDTVNRVSELISRADDTTSGPGNAYRGAVSDDGSCVAFTAAARSALVPADTNGRRDVYLRLRP